ncbi:MAG: hypothetical protein OEO17_14365, partial [Gemmatimonadota bacterium]|nr:hypothetical protein [Gemmatimonadota bacterium]
MSRRTSRRHLFRLGAAVAVAVACGEGTGPRVATYLAVSDTMALNSGESAQLSVTVLAADSTPIAGLSPSFQSLDPTTITVSATGLVTSVGAGGSAVVRVSVDGL